MDDYTLHQGTDGQTAYLLRTWPDGTRELMTRPAAGGTAARWSPPVTLAAEVVS